MSEKLQSNQTSQFTNYPGFNHHCPHCGYCPTCGKPYHSYVYYHGTPQIYGTNAVPMPQNLTSGTQLLGGLAEAPLPS